MIEDVVSVKLLSLVANGTGVRAQACKKDGSLVDGFQLAQTKNILHVYNVQSPAATASIANGREIAVMVEKEFELKKEEAP